MSRAARGRQPATLVRERLLAEGLGARVTLVTGPAGSGKTTLLSHIATRAAVPGTSHCAADWARDPAVMLRELYASLARYVPGDPWTSVQGALRALRGLGRPVYLVVDEVHELEGSAAEADLFEIVRRGPQRLLLLLGSRAVPRPDVSRLRAHGELRELTADDLRFRSWEVEHLFRDVYGEPLAATEVGELTARTGGWAACLRLFHYAVSGRGARARRAALSSVDASGALVDAYLGANVAAALPARLRGFLRDASVLRTLTPALCDEALDRTDSGEMLAELRRYDLVSSGSSGASRCHEPLRAHLERRLRAELGEAEVRARYERAAAALERHGMFADSVRAHAHAGGWRVAHQVAWRHARALVREGWVEPVADALAGDDPWLLLGAARRFRSHGQPVEAVDAYRRAERAFGAAGEARICRDERAALACWVEPLEQPSRDWTGWIRAALGTAAGGLGLEGSPVQARLAEGVVALASGDVRRAIPALTRVAESPAAGATASVVARAALAAAALLEGDESGVREAGRAAEEAERLEVPWVVRLARGVTALSADPAHASWAEPAKGASDELGDAPGSLVGALLLGLGALRRGEDARGALDEAAARARSLGLVVPEAWARAARSLASVREGEPAAREEAVRAEAAARSAGSAGARAFALLAAAEASDDPRLEAAAHDVASEAGLALPARRSGGDRHVVIRCFGGLHIEVDREEIALDGLRPRARQVLRLLLLHAPEPVHRDVIAEALWPGLAEGRASGSLHVALSSLRHVLEAAGLPGIVRDGDAYALDLDGSVAVDVVAFRDAWTAAGIAPDDDGACARAVELYRGDLFPEEGPAEWVVDTRDALRDQAARLAQTAAERLLPGDPGAAVSLCERGLALDPHQDGLWRLLTRAHAEAGNPAAAARAAARYDEVLDALGVRDRATG